MPVCVREGRWFTRSETKERYGIGDEERDRCSWPVYFFFCCLVGLVERGGWFCGFVWFWLLVLSKTGFVAWYGRTWEGREEIFATSLRTTLRLGEQRRAMRRDEVKESHLTSGLGEV